MTWTCQVCDKTMTLERSKYNHERSEAHKIKCAELELPIFSAPKRERHTQHEYFQKFLEKNSEKINQRVICECGGKYTYLNKGHHIKSLKHMAWLDNKEQINLKYD